ncbi:MAG TPA: DUF2520 domain-containing protein [Acidobacteriaceae bacterium]|nr:DUF2520 domain-containing protein [Acidobacteriaceae bacterium]
MQRKLCIIGLGNWGSSLAYAVIQAGMQLDEIIVPRLRSSANRREWARDLPLVTLDRARLEADVLWLCVPDSAITPMADRLVKRARPRGLQGKIVVHSSGALNVEALRVAARAGALVAGIHPMMSFPSRTPVSLQDVPFGVEAEAANRRALHAIVRCIGGRPFDIQAGSKTLYHLAGTMSSPLLVAHLAAAKELAARAGLNLRQAQQVIEPIARATLDNFFLKGDRRSFSGPIARGDVQTIRLHLQALEPHPILADVYRSLARYALEAFPAPRRKALRASLKRK